MTPVQHSLPRSRLVLSGIAAVVGLAASGVATWFYVLGLIELEPSGTARTALIAAGVLLTLGQLAAFGITATAGGELPAGLRRALQALGVALFIFETGSMAVTQLALVQSADAVASASTARAGELQRAIAERRATAASQRALAETQGAAQAITAAARSLRAADAAEAAIAPLAAELAQLQAGRRPTLSTVLGDEQRVAMFATARAALIALVGLVMTSTAGALLGALRAVPADALLHTEEARPLPQSAVQEPSQTASTADRRAAALSLAERLLNPSEFGHAVGPEVRDAARRALGIPAVETPPLRRSG